MYKPILNESRKYLSEAQSFVHSRIRTDVRESLRTPDLMRTSTPISQKTTPRRDTAHKTTTEYSTRLQLQPTMAK